jgi:hypothetical protein
LFRLDLCWPVCLAGENIPAQPPKNLSLRISNPSKCSPIELPFRVQAQSTSTRHVCKPSHPCIRTLTHAPTHSDTPTRTPVSSATPDSDTASSERDSECVSEAPSLDVGVSEAPSLEVREVGVAHWSATSPTKKCWKTSDEGACSSDCVCLRDGGRTPCVTPARSLASSPSAPEAPDSPL